MTPSIKDILLQAGLLVTFENTGSVLDLEEEDYSFQSWDWMRYQPSVSPPLYIAMAYILEMGFEGGQSIHDSVESLEAEELWSLIQPEDLPRFLVDSSDWWHRFHKTGTPRGVYTLELLVLSSRTVLEVGVA